MKYSCNQCDFKLDGTSHTFDKVLVHEKTHLENNELKRLRNKIISSRCRVCNTTKTGNTDQINNDEKWECNTCGNLIDEQGNVLAS